MKTISPDAPVEVLKRATVHPPVILRLTVFSSNRSLCFTDHIIHVGTAGRGNRDQNPGAVFGIRDVPAGDKAIEQFINQEHGVDFRAITGRAAF